MKTRREQLAYMVGLVKYSVDLGLAAAYQFGERNGIKENIHVGFCSKGEQKAEWVNGAINEFKIS
ncbi:hypothetical protein ABEY32_04380 [Bacillus tropicus]|uniref:hypothetical protein n=1 Tax=Bacillus cereus group TaxID=86661 RepID=UPI0022E2ED1E|nr:hypothetical protein [Bacillus cereus group sp. TH254-2LC]MDA1536333.1 hypothetical protein [Bacillus cereus group sp. TH254-2LC]MDA1536338.1 hypothetical protein [Bacillus cereus group sp. TH254-2LC]